MSLSVPVPPTGGREKETMEGKVEIGILVFNLELKKSQNVTSYLCRPSVVPPAVLCGGASLLSGACSLLRPCQKSAAAVTPTLFASTSEHKPQRRRIPIVLFTTLPQWQHVYLQSPIRLQPLLLLHSNHAEKSAPLALLTLGHSTCLPPSGGVYASDLHMSRIKR